ncbi:hypothetical protein Gotur_023103 [Gossypium turneri]
MLNSFIGKIPNAEGSLPRLQVLQLWSNQLSGEIPNYLGTQSDLTILDLSMNNLSGKILDELYHSGHLVTLGNDEGIVELDMFSNLSNLRFLDLSYNGVSVSSSINSSYTWPNLQYLSLASCSLNEFPRFLKGSKHLMSLDLSDNKIHGQNHKWILNKGLDTLSYLNLSHNFLTYIERLPWENENT